mgnify:CR=1 FL=1
MTAVETIGVNGSDKSNISLTSILIVDNDPETIKFIQSKLKDLYTRVEVAENIKNAEILLQRCHFDLIIVDVSQSDNSSSDNSQSDKTALQWINSMRDKGDEVGVIFLAAETDLETAVGALRVGAADFIFKPVDHEQMLSAVKNFFEHKKVKRENFVLKRQIDHNFDHSGIVGDCEVINSLCQVIKRLAPMPSTVLIEGESGTGKELAARAIHRWSNRTGSFVPINCGAMSAELLESELFGHTKGAFTGANQAREGLFSYANHGTLFLDEIGEMPLSMQAHLLRVLEERKIRAVGSNREIALDVRIIAATNKDLKEQVSKGVFREDLYYRLNVLAVCIPSLRERIEDIPLLAQHFISTLSAQLGIQAPVYDEYQFSQLKQYAWPGNVRELKNVIERCLLLNTDPEQCLPGVAAGQAPITEVAPQFSKKLKHIEKQHILKVLEEESGNKSAASRVLGISRKTLERKVQLWKG